MSDEVDQFFLGGAPSLSFLEIGMTHEGRIIHKAMIQARDIATKEPKVWPDGNPVMQAVITMQTDDRDTTIENDDGVRRLFVGSGGMRNAIAAAIKKSGGNGLQVGGRLGIRYTKNGEATTKGFNPPKIYAAKYEAPPQSTDDYEEPPVGEEFSEEPF